MHFTKHAFLSFVRNLRQTITYGLFIILRIYYVLISVKINVVQ